jgi:hypothetical protein
MHEIHAEATSAGSPAAVWALVADVAEWPRWGTWTEGEVEGGGPQEVGAVRVLVKKPYRLRERITAWVPGERMEYELLDGMRVRGYHAVVTLESTGDDGTRIRWHSTYERASLFTALVLRMAIRDAARRLAAAAGP